MAYMVSQLKKSDYGQTNAFMKTVRVTPKIVHTPSPYENLEDEVQGMLATQFDDLGFETTSLDPFDKNTTYFFRCGIRQIYSDYPSSLIWKQETEQKTLNISVTLREDSESTQDIEVIDTFIIPPAVTKDVNYYTYSVVFTPVQTCRTLVLKLNRKGYDVLIEPRDWLTRGVKESMPGTVPVNVKYTGEGGLISKLINIMDNKDYWTRVGFQSRPGTLIVVNLSPVRVGRSGIYELNIGMNINKFMIAAPQGTNSDNIDNFLLDYAWVK